MSLKDLFKKEQGKKATSPKPLPAKTDVKKPQAAMPSPAGTATEPAKTSGSTAVRSHSVLLKSLVTEKGATEAGSGKYLFMVSSEANKIEIKKAIEETYGVRPIHVNIVNFAGKRVNFGRHRGQRKAWKKAVVTLPKGTAIDVYKGV